ncbi:MAG: hypothetical protein ACR2NA_01750 [Solirubrobacterales bacterium]
MSLAALDTVAEWAGEAPLLAAARTTPSPTAAPFGDLVAAGPRTSSESAAYAAALESVREGYLLHFGPGRVVGAADPDLALLGGDYLYARGLQGLTELGDLDAVGELADLISLCAQAHTAGASVDGSLPRALWTVACAAIAGGGGADHEAAKRAARQAPETALGPLRAAARATAERHGFAEQMAQLAEAVPFPRFPDG